MQCSHSMSAFDKLYCCDRNLDQGPPLVESRPCKCQFRSPLSPHLDGFDTMQRRDGFELASYDQVEWPLQRMRLHRSGSIAATAIKCCVSNSCISISPVCPHSSHSLLEIAAQCTNGWSGEAAMRRKPIWVMPPLGRHCPFTIDTS